MYIRLHTIFSTLHPSLLCFYAFGAPVLSMLDPSPWFLAPAVGSALIVHSYFLGGRSTWNALKLLVPAIGGITALNMITNPRGQLVLFTFCARPLTLESLCMGMAGGCMLAAVILWFRCFTAILPNDKFLYLFGKKLPGTALLLSMILKLFPDTKYRMGCIKMADSHTGAGEKDKPIEAVRRGLGQMGSLLEWSMEDSIEMADSMKARAYGTCTRTSYGKYRFTASDAGMFAIMLVCTVISMAGMLSGRFRLVYHPSIRIPKEEGFWFLLLPGVSLVFFLLPLWLELLEIRHRKKGWR